MESNEQQGNSDENIETQSQLTAPRRRESSYCCVAVPVSCMKHPSINVWSDPFLTYLLIREFAIFLVLTHLVPYLQIYRILVNKITSMTPKSNITCRKLSLSFQTVLGLDGRGQSLMNELSIGVQSLRSRFLWSFNVICKLDTFVEITNHKVIPKLFSTEWKTIS